MSIFISAMVFSIPSIASAAGLVPCGGTGEEMCTLCHLIVGIDGLINYGFSIMVVVGLMMLVAAGVIYVISAGNEGMMTMAKSLVKNASIGFALILGAWLIVTTVMWIMGAKENSDEGGVLGIKIESWNTFKCSTARPK